MTYLKRGSILAIVCVFVFLAFYLTANAASATTFDATVTKYSSIDSCTTAACIMANGRSAAVGYAACPTRYRLGTVFMVNGQKYVCGDRTAKRFDGRFDLFAGYGRAAHRRAVAWGKRRERITIISMPK